ncbi:MAG: hypothetical protein EBX42_06690 [Betaproteobacteria bacterium]|nr:hypothetical protein [Betaproteobacteria bacterium]
MHELGLMRWLAACRTADSETCAIGRHHQETGHRRGKNRPCKGLNRADSAGETRRSLRCASIGAR